MANTLHDVTLCLLGNAVNHGIPRCAVSCIDADLHQFVCFKRQVDFRHNVIGKAMLADDDDDLAMMGELA